VDGPRAAPSASGAPYSPAFRLARSFFNAFNLRGELGFRKHVSTHKKGEQRLHTLILLTHELGQASQHFACFVIHNALERCKRRAE
jgi:hypothetical protein